MAIPIGRSTADLRAALLALLPVGVIWSREAGSAIGKVATGLVSSPQRVRARADNLLQDAFPATAFELLPEWEKTLGLPDPCAGPAPTLQQRRAQVKARFAATGGQSLPYFVQLAANLGFAVTTREYAPSRLGQMRLGGRLQSADWAHVWAIRAQQTTVTPFRLGQSGLGEPFRIWGNAVLECELSAHAPAHTTLLFQYA